jgi:uncharacterized DUF497 family protein
MEITDDAEKRAWTLEHRGLDFEDDRRDYGEIRYQTYGLLGDRLVMLVWTPRGDARHIISMRKANEREKGRYEAQFG